MEHTTHRKYRLLCRNQLWSYLWYNWTSWCTFKVVILAGDTYDTLPTWPKNLHSLETDMVGIPLHPAGKWGRGAGPVVQIKALANFTAKALNHTHKKHILAKSGDSPNEKSSTANQNSLRQRLLCFMAPRAVLMVWIMRSALQML
jgi:hypothetical protein